MGYGGWLIHKSMQITTPHMLEFNQIGDELGPNTFMQWVGVVFHTCSCIYPTLNKWSWGLVATHNNVYWHPCGGYMGVVIYTHLCIWLHIGGGYLKLFMHITSPIQLCSCLYNMMHQAWHNLCMIAKIVIWLNSDIFWSKPKLCVTPVWLLICICVLSLYALQVIWYDMYYTSVYW